MDRQEKAKQFVAKFREGQTTTILTDFQIEQIWLNGYNIGQIDQLPNRRILAEDMEFSDKHTE